MNEPFALRLVGGPSPGVRVVNRDGDDGWEWPLPLGLCVRGHRGAYVKETESRLPPLPRSSGAIRGASYVWVSTETQFICAVCGRSSTHPKDGEFGYCGNCHAFTGEAEP